MCDIHVHRGREWWLRYKTYNTLEIKGGLFAIKQKNPHKQNHYLTFFILYYNDVNLNVVYVFFSHQSSNSY